jgi:chitinase
VVVVGLERLNRWVAGFAVAVVTCVGGALLVSTSADAATNLVNNGDFEAGSTTGWACPATASVIGSPVHGGSHALTVAPTSSDNGQCTQTVAVAPSSAYTLSAWVIGSYVYLGDTGTGTTDTSNWTPSATSYSQLTVTFTTGASTHSVGIYVHGWYAQPAYDVDDITLTGPGGTVTVPSAPTGLTVIGTTSTSAALSWAAASGTVTGYNVYRNGTKVGTSASTSFTDSGLTASTTYTYAVSASNSAGESAKSASVQATTSASGGTSVPSAPSGLRVTGTTSTSASLAWTAPAGTVTGYGVYRNGTKVGSSASTSFTDSGLTAATTYTYTVSASNSAGESAKSASVQVTTSAATGGGGGSLPAHVLTGYWQDFVNGAKALRLSDVPTTYDLVAVAFANADPARPGGVTFSVDSGLTSALGGYSDANFTSDIATLHSRGQKVIISVGGQNGTISVSDSTSANNFASSINSLISQFGFDGVDIDLENGVNPTFMSQALHSIASAHSGAIITLAPQTIDMQSTGMAYFQLALNIKSILTIVNTQFYNSGTMNGCDGGVYAESTENFMTALACIQVQGGLSPSQIGLGLPASTSAAGGGFVSPSTVNSALDCLDLGTNCGSFKPSTTYTGLRGAMTWSINWDASNGYAFANTVHPHLASLH